VIGGTTASATAALEIGHASRSWQRGPILVIGGGIGGLSAALALAQAGFPTVVLERRAAHAEEGAGIQIGPNGTALLRRLGVAELLAPDVGVPEAIEVLDGEGGEPLARLPLGDWIAQRHGAPYWLAHRRDLHDALARRARETSLIGVFFEADVQEIERDEGRSVRLRTRDGRVWDGSALVGSDGLWSITRQKVFSDEAPASTGFCAVRTTIKVDGGGASRFHRDTFVWMRPDAHLVHYPVSGGREIAVVCVLKSQRVEADWSNAVDTDWVLEQTARFPAEARSLLRSATQWRRWSLFKLSRSFDYARGNIALIGDAAHPIMPFLAQGAVMAMEDAVTLADAMTASDDVSAAFAVYARSRRDRVARVAAVSRRNGQIYHLSGLPAAMRNLSLRLLPAELIMSGYDWLYGWKPHLA
jgi:salicylate hydroxylase